MRSIIEKKIIKKHIVVGLGKDGIEGLELYKKHNPNVVLLDITMPNLNGKDCLKAILEYNKKAIVIMVSGVESQDLIDECVKIGAKSFINKQEISMAEDFGAFLQKIEQIVGVI